MILEINSIILNRYKIIESIAKDTNHVIYLAQDIEENVKVVINQLDQQLQWDLRNNQKDVTGIRDIHWDGERCYFISTLSTGMYLREFISTGSISLKWRLNLVINLLTSLDAMPSDMPLYMKNALLNIDNITVKDDKIAFNHMLIKTDAGQVLSNKDLFLSMGKVIYFIFSGDDLSSESCYQDIPPDIIKIIKNIIQEIPYYNSIQDIIKDLSSTSLYQLFYQDSKKPQYTLELDQSTNPQKADKILTKKAQASWLKPTIIGMASIAILLIVVLMLKDRDLPSLIGKDNSVETNNPGKETKGNNPPIAKLSKNIHQIQVGDTVTFKSESIDPDFNDYISAYAWQLFKDNEAITSSADMFFQYQFTKAGNYKVVLTVSDSKGLWSDAITQDFQVNPPSLATSIVQNLKYNQTFEPRDNNSQLPQEWEGINHRDIAYDSTSAYRGINSLRIISLDNAKEFGARVKLNINNTQYEAFKNQGVIASGWIRGDGSDMTVSLKVKLLDAQGKTLSVTTQKPISLTSRWTLVTSNFNLPKDCGFIEIDVIATQRGTIWIDHFEIDVAK